MSDILMNKEKELGTNPTPSTSRHQPPSGNVWEMHSRQRAKKNERDETLRKTKSFRMVYKEGGCGAYCKLPALSPPVKFFQIRVNAEQFGMLTRTLPLSSSVNYSSAQWYIGPPFKSIFEKFMDMKVVSNNGDPSWQSGNTEFEVNIELDREMKVRDLMYPNVYDCQLMNQVEIFDSLIKESTADLLSFTDRRNLFILAMTYAREDWNLESGCPYHALEVYTIHGNKWTDFELHLEKLDFRVQYIRGPCTCIFILWKIMAEIFNSITMPEDDVWERIIPLKTFPRLISMAGRRPETDYELKLRTFGAIASSVQFDIYAKLMREKDLLSTPCTKEESLSLYSVDLGTMVKKLSEDLRESALIAGCILELKFLKLNSQKRACLVLRLKEDDNVLSGNALINRMKSVSTLSKVMMNSWNLWGFDLLWRDALDSREVAMHCIKLENAVTTPIVSKANIIDVNDESVMTSNIVIDIRSWTVADGKVHYNQSLARTTEGFSRSGSAQSCIQ